MLCHRTCYQFAELFILLACLRFKSSVRERSTRKKTDRGHIASCSKEVKQIDSHLVLMYWNEDCHPV